MSETDLVRRGPWLVHADTDELFKNYVFARGAGRPTFNEGVPLTFYVDHEGDLVFLERGLGTWSEYIARRAKRRRSPA